MEERYLLSTSTLMCVYPCKYLKHVHTYKHAITVIKQKEAILKVWSLCDHQGQQSNDHMEEEGSLDQEDSGAGAGSNFQSLKLGSLF